RPALDARLAEPRLDRARLRNRGGGGRDRRRPARPRLLGAVVPRRLDLRDARADPALVLLDLVHGGHARRRVAVPEGADVREAAGRDRARDAPLLGERDRRERGVRANGRRCDALALLRRDAKPEPEAPLRAGPRGAAPAAHALG